MALSKEKIKAFRRIGHALKPVVIISEQGVSEGVSSELERALADHELIKVKVNCADRQQKQQLIAQVCETGQCELVQSIGKIALLYRANPKPNKKLSNIARHYLN